MVVKIASYYNNELGVVDRIRFYLFDKLYNNILRNATKNFFPLLTDLVKKIYSNFNIQKNDNDCNDFIKLKISQYFDIDMEIDETKFNHYELNQVDDVGTCCGGDDRPAPKPKFVKVFVQHETYIPDSFDINKFKKDYINLGKLFWNSRPEHPKDEQEKQKMEETEKLGDAVFSNINEISPFRIYQLIERDFGKDNSKRDATNEEKIILKLFYISYTCNELISSITWTINQKEYNINLICDFYYKIFKSYNEAINGLIEIKKDIERRKEDNEYK